MASVLSPLAFQPPVEMPPPADPEPEPWGPGRTSVNGAGADSTMQEASEAGLFAGKRFLLVGFEPDAETELSSLLVDNAGKVLMMMMMMMMIRVVKTCCVQSDRDVCDGV